MIEPVTKIFKIAPFSKAKLPLVAFLGTQPKDGQLIERLAKSESLASSFLKRL